MAYQKDIEERVLLTLFDEEWPQDEMQATAFYTCSTHSSRNARFRLDPVGRRLCSFIKHTHSNNPAPRNHIANRTRSMKIYTFALLN